MSMFKVETPVGQFVIKQPRLARVFERLGIDYCCGGRLTLEQACRAKGLDIALALRELAAGEALAPDEEHRRFDGPSASMVDLTDHIVATHHAYLRRELPRLAALAAQVFAAHGSRHPELHELRSVFESMRNELTLHMLKEERVLFPIIAQLDAATEMPPFHCGTVMNPIRVMEYEHDDTGEAMSRIRELTGDYTVPADACLTYRALLDGLAELEAELHLHIHEENNILFPRARAAEDALQTATAQSCSR
jgi:regulator of cell morphogenesis and NO signaling